MVMLKKDGTEMWYICCLSRIAVKIKTFIKSKWEAETVVTYCDA